MHGLGVSGWVETILVDPVMWGAGIACVLCDRNVVQHTRTRWWSRELSPDTSDCGAPIGGNSAVEWMIYIYIRISPLPSSLSLSENVLVSNLVHAENDGESLDLPVLQVTVVVIDAVESREFCAVSKEAEILHTVHVMYKIHCTDTLISCTAPRCIQYISWLTANASACELCPKPVSLCLNGSACRLLPIGGSFRRWKLWKHNARCHVKNGYLLVLMI